MRMARKLIVLALLLLAPFAAIAAEGAEAADGPKCGDCQCSDNQCCSKSWTGSCKCYTCEAT